MKNSKLQIGVSIILVMGIFFLDFRFMRPGSEVTSTALVSNERTYSSAEAEGGPFRYFIVQLNNGSKVNAQVDNSLICKPGGRVRIKYWKSFVFGRPTFYSVIDYQE